MAAKMAAEDGSRDIAAGEELEEEAGEEDEDSDDAAEQEDLSTIVLLDVFLIRGRPHRCFFHGNQIVWEEQLPTSATSSSSGGGGHFRRSVRQRRTVVPIADLVQVRAATEPQSDAATIGGQPQHQPTSLIVYYAARRHSATSTTTPTTPGQPKPATSDCSAGSASFPFASASAPSSSAPAANVWRLRHAQLHVQRPADAAQLAALQRWTRTLRRCLRRLRDGGGGGGGGQRPRQLAVFVNPFGGRRRALQLWQQQVLPLLRLAGIRVARLCVTQRAGEIREALAGGGGGGAGGGGWDLSRVDGVVCVGGDGTVAEVFNGLVERAQWDRTERWPGLDDDDDDDDVGGRQDGGGRRFERPRLPVGIIPGGSTDTVAYCLHGTTDVRTAAIHIILGGRTGLDLASVSSAAGRLIRLYASVLSYGYLGDVAADSEQFRWMGPHRYEYSGFKKFFANRGYAGEIAIPISSDEEEEEEGDDDDDDTEDTADTEDTEDNGIAIHSGNRRSTSPLANGTVDNAEATRPKGVRSPQVGHPDDGVLCHENCGRCTSQLLRFKRNGAKRSMAMGNGADRRWPHRNTSPQPATIDSSCNTLDTLDTIGSAGTILARQRSDDADDGIHSAGTATTASAELAARLDPRRRWRILHGRFFMVSGANLSCACRRSPNGFSRFSHVGDGRVDLVLVRHTNYVQNLRLLMRMASRRQRISELSFVEIHRVRCFHFRSLASAKEAADGGRGVAELPSANCSVSVIESTAPIVPDDGGGGREPDVGAEEQQQQQQQPRPKRTRSTSRWNCDGEVVADADVFVESHCQLVQVFRRGPARPANHPQRTSGGLKHTFCGWCRL